MLHLALRNVTNNADWSRVIQFRDAEGEPVDVTGWDMRFGVRTIETSRVTLLEAGMAQGFVAIVDGPQGKVRLTLRRPFLAERLPGSYEHELVRFHEDGTRTTIWRGSLEIVDGIIA